ncbi:YjjG family noncanonical pyrimidine nucleotidase [Paenibacillus sp. YYML68]|uniref:YjjG family noncanonical pyrimidine nucleotidase n=1 Tax=Paenibacillus sp. YYML68 TaxID=2909250 RepID=UPI00248F5D95|nr:YjjG family noncanonical pyrimidine nucleotidase [Paenibacillus sp. YYML68]
MPYELILLDVDDTLLDFQLAEEQALVRVFLEQNIHIDQLMMDRFRAINQRLWTQFELGYIELNTLRTERFMRLLTEFHIDGDANRCSEAFLQHLSEEAFMMEGALELCNYLSDQKYRLGIITNGIREVQIRRLQKAGIFDRFEEVIVSEDAGFQKPHQGIFDYTLNKLKVSSKEHVLIIGDSITSDIQGGIQYGIHTCWFNPLGKKNASSFSPNYEIRRLMDVVRILEEYRIS